MNSSGEVQGRCRALFSYQPANPDELPLCVGDVLEVLAEVEEGWWQGRRQGRIGVFPSNFVEMLDSPQPQPPFEPAPALPPKPFKELCRVLFPYSAVNEDELTLAEGDIVTIISKDAPDRGWWRGEINGRVGLFPDNFVQLLPPKVKTDTEEKKPDRPPSKTPNVYPILNKYSENTASIKELTTSRISMHKENTVSKESSTQSTVTHTNKSESEKTVHSETTPDGTLDGQIKKPPVPLKKSPTLSSGVGGLFSGLKSKMLATTEREKATAPGGGGGGGGGGSGSSSGSGGELDRADGPAGSKAGASFDHVERGSLLHDPRARRVKAPRRRPPSQSLRDDTPQQIGLSNGHEVAPEKPAPSKAEEIKPRAREWEKHKAPWMEELKLNQARKTGAGAGSTDRLLECGLEEKKSSSHSMEMSKSTSSISSKMSIMESFEESKVRHSLDSKKDTCGPRDEPSRASAGPHLPAAAPAPPAPSPTAAGRTLAAMLDEIKKPLAPQPPSASVRTTGEYADKSTKENSTKTVHSTEKYSEMNSISKTTSVIESSPFKSEVVEKGEERKTPERTILNDKKTPERTVLNDKSASATLERSKPKTEKAEGSEALIAQLNNRITNLEKLIEVQNSMFNAAIDELNAKLKTETEKRLALQSEIEKLAHCVTQV
ncbi:SH3 domain-containing protein 21-like isoform X2 [Plodia interpunctella]|uniref:SH3 domain-containing protein 21-like isoform X2 n=1 Tax=Plodia interpunctella TaxID=58824 RepID=UPI0023677DEA|nr:SH3 domain-containing protein 21-like isoform X2 [Plodia interpunctella]